MPASAPLTTLRPRRGLLRSSVLGMGLLVAGSAVASPALAEEGTEPEEVDLDAAQPVELSATAGPLVTDEEWTATSPAGFEVPAPDFGMGKTFTIDLSAPRDAPVDLSLAGAEFDLVRSDGKTVGATCTTTHDGTCSFYSSTRYSETPSASNAQVEAGYMYMLRQSRRSTGLALLPGDLGTFYVCGGGECSGGRYAYFTPDSLFHRTLDGIATEADSGAALAGTAFGLTGPGYPRNDGTVAPASGSWGTATSDGDGLLSWSGWFLPGDYALSAVSDGDGPLAGEPAEVTFADWAPFQEGRPSVEVALRYVRPVVEPGDGGASDGGSGETPGAPGDGGGQGGAGEGPVVPGGGTAPATGAPSTGSPATSTPATSTPATSTPATSAPARPSAGAPEDDGSQGTPAGRPLVGDPTAGVAPGASAPEAPQRPSVVVAGLGAVEVPSVLEPASDPAPTGAAPRPVAAPPVTAATAATPRLETAGSGVTELQAIGLGALLLGTVGAGFLLLRMRRRNRDA